MGRGGHKLSHKTEDDGEKKNAKKTGQGCECDERQRREWEGVGRGGHKLDHKTEDDGEKKNVKKTGQGGEWDER